MIKAIRQSKWWWYIPIFSLVFIKEMGKWTFEAETNIESNYRSVLVTYTVILIHVPAILVVLIKTGILPQAL